MNVNFIPQLLILMRLMHYSLETCEYVDRTHTWECTNLTDFEEIPNNPTYLIISKSNIQVIRPSLFTCDLSFNSLNKLWMPNNKIALLEPGSFKALRNLVELNFTKNNIKNISKGVFNGMYSLSLLDLSHNQIQTIDSNSFDRTDSLKKLYLNDNLISNTTFLINNCKNVDLLDLSNNRLEELQFVKSCWKLSKLNANRNNLSTFSTIDLGSQITFLDLSDNNISYIQRPDLKNLISLQTLNLSRNPLFAERNMHVDLFQDRYSLTSLNLSSTCIEKLSVGVFSPLRYLEVLDLSSNNLVYLPNSIFHDSITLKEVHLEYNRLSNFDFYFNSAASFNVDFNGNLVNCDSLLKIINRFGIGKFLGAKSYNTSNIYGIACQEKIVDFKKMETYTSSGTVNVQREHLSHMSNNQADFREIFAELKALLKQSVQNIPSLKEFFNETSLHLQDLRNSMRRQRFDDENLLMNLTNAFESLSKLANVLTKLKNDTDFKVLEEKNDIAVKQLIIELKSIILSLNNNLLSTRTDAFGLNSLQTMPSEALKNNSPTITSNSDSITSYCIVAILLAILCLLIIKQCERYKLSRNKHEESNPLNTLTV